MDLAILVMVWAVAAVVVVVCATIIFSLSLHFFGLEIKDKSTPMNTTTSTNTAQYPKHRNLRKK